MSLHQTYFWLIILDRWYFKCAVLSMEHKGGNENLSSPSPTLCTTGCGYYGNPAFDGMCSKCFKDALKRRQQSSSATLVQAPQQFDGIKYTLIQILNQSVYIISLHSCSMCANVVRNKNSVKFIHSKLMGNLLFHSYYCYFARRMACFYYTFLLSDG